MGEGREGIHRVSPLEVFDKFADAIRGGAEAGGGMFSNESNCIRSGCKISSRPSTRIGMIVVLPLVMIAGDAGGWGGATGMPTILWGGLVSLKKVDFER